MDFAQGLNISAHSFRPALDHMMLNVMASFAEFERDMTASRIAEARAYLKANGRRVAVANAQGWRPRKGQPWTARQVLYTLTNHLYAGLVIDGYGFRDGCHQRSKAWCCRRSVWNERDSRRRRRRPLSAQRFGKLCSKPIPAGSRSCFAPLATLLRARLGMGFPMKHRQRPRDSVTSFRADSV